MDENQADAVAEALGGETWQILLRRGDGGLVVISDEVVCEYEDEAAFESNRPKTSVVLH